MLQRRFGRGAASFQFTFFTRLYEYSLVVYRAIGTKAPHEEALRFRG